MVSVQLGKNSTFDRILDWASFGGMKGADKRGYRLVFGIYGFIITFLLVLDGSIRVYHLTSS